jgi:DNA-binding transcriptional ArsR family regulator
MSQSDAAHAVQRTAPDPLEDDGPSVDVAEVLSLLSDEYAREILNLLVDQPHSARELVNRLDMSRATVYRRLDDLESAGVVESSLCLDPDGHHRKCFSAAVDCLRLLFESDGLRLEVGPEPVYD